MHGSWHTWTKADAALKPVALIVWFICINYLIWNSELKGSRALQNRLTHFATKSSAQKIARPILCRSRGLYWPSKSGPVFEIIQKNWHSVLQLANMGQIKRCLSILSNVYCCRKVGLFTVLANDSIWLLLLGLVFFMQNRVRSVSFLDRKQSGSPRVVG